MKIKRTIPIIIVAISLAVYFHFCDDYTENRYKKNIEIFDSNNINGIITMREVRDKGSAFKIENSSHIYVFYPYTDEILNRGKIFNLFAEPGDSIVKEANSDTLYLYKNNEVYRYTFKRW